MPKRIIRVDGKLVDLKRVQIVEPPEMTRIGPMGQSMELRYALTMVSGVTIKGSNVDDYPSIEKAYIALMEADNPTNLELSGVDNSLLPIVSQLEAVTTAPKLPEVKVKFEARVNGNAYVFEVGSVVLATVCYITGAPALDLDFSGYYPEWLFSIRNKSYQNTEDMRDAVRPYVESYVKALFG